MTTGRPTNAFFRFAAVCACLYLAAQLFQWTVLTFLSAPPATQEDAILQRLLVMERARSLAVLLSFPALLVAYAGVALRTARGAPAVAVLGLLFGSLFVVLELAYRSIDVFLVTEQWAHAMAEATDPVLRGEITGRVDVWRQVVPALYFPLLLAHAAASAFLAVGVRASGTDRLGRVLSWLLVVNAIRALGRMAEMHLGVHALGTINGWIYLPVTIALLAVMAAWLWKPERAATPSLVNEPRSRAWPSASR